MPERYCGPATGIQGIVGGEGLEQDLLQVQQEGRLFGILNGCEYPAPTDKPTSAEIFDLIEQDLDNWVERGQGDSRGYYHALKCLNRFRRESDIARPCLVSIGRLTAQKLYLLVQKLDDVAVMDRLLQRLTPGTFIMLGSGDPHYARFFTRVMQQHPNFLYLDGYSEPLATALYGFGDLFVMPSIYEPCGISQMLAMRAGVPCLVHRVGGLNDTVHNGENGFSFGGASLEEKQHGLLDTLDQALTLYRGDTPQWQSIALAAARSRFTWDHAIKQYLEQLYSFPERG